MRVTLRVRAMGVLVPLACLLALSVQPVAAYQILSVSGNHGNFVVTDTQAHPGAHCFYPNTATNTDLDRIKIPAPQVFSTDRTSHRDKQKVGWQYIIQHGTSPGSAPTGWTTSYKSSIVKATAYDDQAAPFTFRIWDASKNINRWWRVEIAMFWYLPGSSTNVDGKAKVLIEYYLITYPPGPNTWEPTACLPDE